MSFVHDKTGPPDGCQGSLVNGDQLVGGEEDVELHLSFSLWKKEGSSTAVLRPDQDKGLPKKDDSSSLEKEQIWN